MTPPNDMRATYRLVLIACGFLFAAFLLFSTQRALDGGISPPSHSEMPVYHVVAFKLAPEHVGDLTPSMLALERNCKREGKQYIRSITGGRQTSTEGFDDGRQVVFIVEFENNDDRDYYVEQDEAHNAFKDEIKAYGVEGVTVLDFTDGAF